MCGRYVLFRLDQWLKNFPQLELPPNLAPNWNIAPTQATVALSNQHLGQLKWFHWGLIPSWAKDAKIGNRMINARAETLGEKPAFRAALRRRRCLVPADGFYEWRKEGGGRKTPMFIHLSSGDPMALAGLWDTWRAPDGGEILSLSIITTAPNELMKPIHDRMPAIVRRADYQRWLNPAEVAPEAVADVLAPFPAAEMAAHPVSPRMNKPEYDRADCIAPAETGMLF